MSKLFDSFTDPIPPVRYDVQRIPVQQNGQAFIYFHDQMRYATSDFALPADSEAILSLINGVHSVQDILSYGADDITKEQVLHYIQFLDEHQLLMSDHFRSEAERIESAYEASDTHNTTTAGSSYPSDPDKLNAFLAEAFEQYEQSKPVNTARALYAPHIDTRVGMESYVKAFSRIRNLKPKKVILLATSHYSGLYPDQYKDAPFIISGKNFRMPNGEVMTDPAMIETLKQFQNEMGERSGLTFSDRAHRIEHSIELHLLFLNFIWSHKFSILPVLVGGMDELFYTEDSFRQQQLDHFSSVLTKLADEDTFFLISGDLSHFGHKFGDESGAAPMLSEAKSNDTKFMAISSSGDPALLIDFMKKDFDKYRICGFPPLLTFLNAFKGVRGEQLTYDLWDERERQSAVSFGSILY